jgi:hypothetical protein
MGLAAFCRSEFPTLMRGANEHCAYGADQVSTPDGNGKCAS